MNVDEIIRQIEQLPIKDREIFLQNLQKITFDFKINKSFLNPKYQHPITIKKEVYDFMDIHGVSTTDNATFVFPNGVSTSAYIRSSKAGWGFYYQIKVRGGISGVSNLVIGESVTVAIENNKGRILIQLILKSK